MLRLKSYWFLARGLQRPVGKFNIVAVWESELVFLENIAFTRQTTPATSLCTPQNHMIELALVLYVARFSALVRLNQRFDMVPVQPWRWIFHLNVSWRLRSAF